MDHANPKAKALDGVVEKKLMSPKTRAYILHRLAEKNPVCLRFVAEKFDCREVVDLESRHAIYAARDAYKKHQQDERRLENQTRPAPPPRAAERVGTYSSRGAADGRALYRGSNGGIFHMSDSGNQVYHRRTSSPSVPMPRMSSSSSTSRPSGAISIGHHVSSGSANGRELFQGRNGGVYHMSANGNKVYHKR